MDAPASARSTRLSLAALLALDVAAALTIRLTLAGWPHLGWLRWLASATVWLAPLPGVALWRAHRSSPIISDAGPDAAERLRRVLASTRDLVWAMDRDGVLTFGSPQSADLFGYTPEEVVGRPVSFLIHPPDVERAQHVVTAAMSAGEGWKVLRVRCVHRDGSLLWVDTSGNPIFDRTGRVIGYDGSFALTSEPAGSLAASHLGARDRVLRVLADDTLLRVAFQPIVSLTTSGMIGVEALSRFDERSPADWFADAHAVGLGVDLELLATRRALARLPQLHPDLYLSINVSPSTLASPLLFDTLRSAAEALSRIVLELTEHVSIRDYDAVQLPLGRLRRAGVRLAIDDAGAGYASFQHVLQLRPDIIKLDRSLITGIDTDLARRALAASLTAFAVQVDAAVVAEGVETAAELDTVITLGLDAAQGYLLHRPTTDPAQWLSWSPGAQAARRP